MFSKHRIRQAYSNGNTFAKWVATHAGAAGYTPAPNQWWFAFQQNNLRIIPAMRAIIRMQS